MKRLYLVDLKDTERQYKESEPVPTWGVPGHCIRVLARSFTEAIEETQKAYGPRYVVTGVRISEQEPNQPKDLL